MTVFVISIQLVRSLIRCPKNMVLAHVKGMNIHRRPRAHIPLIEELSIFVELLNAPVVAIVDENEGESLYRVRKRWTGSEIYAPHPDFLVGKPWGTAGK